MSSDNQSCAKNRHGTRASESQDSDRAKSIRFLRLASFKIRRDKYVVSKNKPDHKSNLSIDHKILERRTCRSDTTIRHCCDTCGSMCPATLTGGSSCPLF
eukprot:scaffold6248_cov87-Cylindrotheca_fusiformis.AAC.3